MVSQDNDAKRSLDRGGSATVRKSGSSTDTLCTYLFMCRTGRAREAHHLGLRIQTIVHSIFNVLLL